MPISHDYAFCLRIILFGLLALPALWMIGAFGTIPSSARYPSFMAVGAGWALIAVISYYWIVLIRSLFSHRELVRIRPSGISHKVTFGRSIPWSEIKEVSTFKHSGHNHIMLHLKDAAKYINKGPVWVDIAINRWMTNGDIALNFSLTDRRFEDAMVAITWFRPREPGGIPANPRALSGHDQAA